MPNDFWCVGLIVMRCFAGEPAQPAATVCPPVREWSASFQKKLASELRAAPGNSAMAKVVIETIGDRKVARACKGK